MSLPENRPVRFRVHTRQLWVERLQRFADSGTTVVAFCQQEGTSAHAFYYLRETLMGLFALGEKPTAALSQWLPDRWLLRQARGRPPSAVG